ncbi:MAG: DNA polymerase/3'-5' exonuclease PolX [Myxococcaceae bacterium]|nr:DNA polymerase/3'-5' exonuclease PolX [Myxococcaceae bacterium]
MRELSAYLQLSGENAFKVRAYELAAERIAGLSEELGPLIAEGRLTALPGIGESIAKKIEALATTGTMEPLAQLRDQFPPKILELLTVPELGPKKAKALLDQLGVGSLDDLERACREQKVRALKGFGQKSEEKLLAGLELARRAHASGGRKRLGEVQAQAEALLEWVRAAPGVVRASLGGSVRRQRETVADVDLIASAAHAAPVFAHFERFPQVAEVLGAGASKASVRLKETDLQVDLRVLPDEDFASALHHFTGSKAHHIKLRGLALERGLTISEWGVHRVKGGPAPEPGVARHAHAEAKLPVPDEAALYALLGMQFVPPELREDWGEVEAALEQRLPTDLVTRGDVLGNVHAHSTWSDGADSLEAMARAALALGYSYFTVTEHSQTSGYAGGLTLDRLKAQWDEIDRINETVKGIRLLKGVESDILEDGRLDYPDEVLERLDVVIGSVHQRHGQDEAQMTRRLLAAFDNPFLHIWGHPTGRLLNKREPAPMRLEEVLDKAARKGVIVEVNGCPERMDLSPEHVRLALARGLKLSLSTDAHATRELAAHLPFALACARKGWARRSDVINTFEVSGFLGALRRN